MKRGLNVDKKAFMTEQVSAIIQCKTPVKYKDPSCPTISMNIGGTCVEKALLDRSIKIPKDTMEDVLIQVDKFYYPVDFVVLDTEPVVVGAIYVPIILGRPFLATSNAIINFLNGVMQLTFGNMTLELNIFHLSKMHMQPVEEGPEEVCIIDTIMEEQAEQQKLQDVLIEELSDCSEDLQGTQNLCIVHGLWRKKEEFLPLLAKEDKEKEGIDEPQNFDLKPLPVELKYAYLEENNQCPVVISSLLNASQESSLLEVLRKNKQAIGWKISDLKGISPFVYTHHIYLEEEARLVRQPQ